MTTIVISLKRRKEKLWKVSTWKPTKAILFRGQRPIPRGPY